MEPATQLPPPVNADDVLPTYEVATNRDPPTLIAPYVGRGDLFSASLVNRRWRNAFMKEIWERPDQLWELGDRPVLSTYKYMHITTNRSKEESILTQPQSKIPPIPPNAFHHPRCSQARALSIPNGRPSVHLLQTAREMALAGLSASSESAVFRCIVLPVFRPFFPVGCFPAVTHGPTDALRYLLHKHHRAVSHTPSLAPTVPRQPRSIRHKWRLPPANAKTHRN